MLITFQINREASLGLAHLKSLIFYFRKQTITDSLNFSVL